MSEQASPRPDAAQASPKRPTTASTQPSAASERSDAASHAEPLRKSSAIATWSGSPPKLRAGAAPTSKSPLPPPARYAVVATRYVPSRASGAKQSPPVSPKALQAPPKAAQSESEAQGTSVSGAKPCAHAA